MISIEEKQIVIKIADTCPLEKLAMIQRSLIDVLTIVGMVDDGCMLDSYKHSIVEVLTLVQDMSFAPEQMFQIAMKMKEED